MNAFFKLPKSDLLKILLFVRQFEAELDSPPQCVPTTVKRRKKDRWCRFLGYRKFFWLVVWGWVQNLKISNFLHNLVPKLYNLWRLWNHSKAHRVKACQKYTPLISEACFRRKITSEHDKLSAWTVFGLSHTSNFTYKYVWVKKTNSIGFQRSIKELQIQQQLHFGLFKHNKAILTKTTYFER